MGKGRDVGLCQTQGFVAKISMGNGEQLLSRDLFRLGNQAGFVRCLSLYFTSVGSFLSQVMSTIHFPGVFA